MSRLLPGGRRGRRLRRTLGWLVALLVVAAGLGIFAYLRTRPEVRKPGETLDDITQNLTLNLPAGAPRPRLTDVTSEAGLDAFRTFHGARTSQLPEDMGSGLAWGDYDNDGDDDLFVVGAGGSLSNDPSTWTPSVLYENLGDGRFRRVEQFPDVRIMGMAAAWGDYDNDGRLDLVVTGYQSLQLFHNDGGSFSPGPKLPAPPGYWAGATWGDFDNDHDLDLYVCGYVQYRPETGSARQASRQFNVAVPYTLNPASYEPERNLLFRNDGGGRFVDVAKSMGVDDPSGRSLSAIWVDLDQDGRLDLYVANDISDNALFLNRRSRFFDAGLITGVADYRGAMGLAAGDWNRDGDDDLFITHWVAQENALYDSRLVDLAKGIPPAQVARNSSNEKDKTRLIFTDLASPLGLGQIALQSVGWGTDFVDLDSDGWLDLLVANGSTLETEETPKRLRPQPPMVLWNDHGHGFHDLAPSSRLLSVPHVARGLATADYDLDGDVDVAIVQLDGGVQLLRNDMPHGHWLEIRLHSRLPGKADATGFGDGSTVIVHAGGRVFRRTVTSASYLSQSSRTLHFGLGDLTQIDGVEVQWLGGESQQFRSLSVDAGWDLTQGESTPRAMTMRAPALASSGGRAHQEEFWKLQRAAMDAMKRDQDPERAAKLLQRALTLEPDHLDARYYLANALAATGKTDEALRQLDILRQRDPESHRAHKQWGVLRAMTAHSDADLAAAYKALERAHQINPEETGSLLMLGQIALLRGQRIRADQQLAWACRTNPKAVGGFFLRGYIAWKRGDEEAAIERLSEARTALGDEWKPEGAAAEGDVSAKMHRETSPLARYWESWDGTPNPRSAFARLDAYLTSGHDPGNQL